MHGWLPDSALCKVRAVDYLQTKPRFFPPSFPSLPHFPLFLSSFLPSLLPFPESIPECSAKCKWLIKVTHFCVIKCDNTSFIVGNSHNIYYKHNYGLTQINDSENT